MRAGTGSTSRVRSHAVSAVEDERAGAATVPQAAPPQWCGQANRRRLTRMLIAGDGLALFVGFALPLVFVFHELGPRTDLVGVGEALLLTIAGLWVVGLQGLWTTNVTSVRVVEVSRITRVLSILAIIALVADRKSSVNLRVAGVIVAVVAGWLVFVAWRSIYRAYIAAEHRRGRYLSRVIVVGTDRRASDLHRLFEVHPELGLRVVGVLGRRHEAVRRGLGDFWLGDTLDAASVLDAVDAELVVFCSADLDPALVHSLTTQERVRHRPVYVDPGLSRVDLRRMKATSIGYQPLLELESAALSATQRAVKRGFDYVVGAALAAIFAPVMLVIAVCIKLGDRGPVLFAQERVGRGGERFRMYKFRSMHVDAEQRLAELKAQNERSGILFKMSDDRDPRITRVGRIIRKLSLDEIPQIFNVFLGTMSVVGPRPALPDEVAQFPAELLARHTVRPGITGLWQAEARDNEHFEAYHRLDLFYVENWSLLFDIVILLATVEHFVLRPMFRGVSAAPPSGPHPGDDRPVRHDGAGSSPARAAQAGHLEVVAPTADDASAGGAPTQLAT